MHRFILAAVMTAFAGPAAASDKTDAEAVVKTFFTGTDMSAGVKLCAPDAIIIDDFGKHVWQGKDACAAWMRDYLADIKKAGVKPLGVAITRTNRVDINGSNAYVVSSATSGYSGKAGKVVKDAIVTTALRKTADGWRITGWAWGKL